MLSVVKEERWSWFGKFSWNIIRAITDFWFYEVNNTPNWTFIHLLKFESRGNICTQMVSKRYFIFIINFRCKSLTNIHKKGIKARYNFFKMRNFPPMMEKIIVFYFLTLSITLLIIFDYGCFYLWGCRSHYVQSSYLAVDVWTICCIIFLCFMMSNSNWFWSFCI